MFFCISQVLAIALLYALIIKTPEEDRDEVTAELVASGMGPAHDVMTMDDLTDPEKLAQLHKRKNKAFPPPDQGLLAAQREQRYQ